MSIVTTAFRLSVAVICGGIIGLNRGRRHRPIGLAIGAGYFEAGVIATLFVLLAEIVLSKIEWYISSKAKNINIYIEYDEGESIAGIAEEIKKLDVGIIDIEITRSKAAEGPLMGAIFVIQLSRKSKRTEILQNIARIRGVTTIEEL